MRRHHHRHVPTARNTRQVDARFIDAVPFDDEVHGIKRRASLINTARIDHIYADPHVENSRFRLHYGDMTDSSSLQRTIQRVQPDEIYNLAAQSHVKVSFEVPEYTANVDALDPAVDLDVCADGAVAHDAQIALNNAFGFGGINTSAVLRRAP